MHRVILTILRASKFVNDTLTRFHNYKKQLKNNNMLHKKVLLHLPNKQALDRMPNILQNEILSFANLHYNAFYYRVENDA